MQSISQHTTKEKGFALLYAVLVASLVLSIGLSIFNLTLREFKLSAQVRESQVALFAADMGLECALFYDLQIGGFLATTAPYINPPPNTFVCDGDYDFVYTPPVMTNGPYDEGGGVRGREYVFTINNPDNNDDICAEVVVRKQILPNKATRIESRGRNTCDTDARIQVERGLRATY